MLLLKNLYNYIVPVTLRNIIWSYRFRYSNADMRQLRKQVLDYYKKQPPKDKEAIDVLRFIKRIGVVTFPHSFFLKYDFNKVKVYKDELLNLPYVLHEGKRLYYKRSLSETEIKESYAFISTEQDIASPHRYLLDNFNVESGDTVLDIGAAEGNFSLSIVEKASKLIIFEADPDWMEPLAATFSPWKNKVHVVNKYVSDIKNDTNITIDEFLGDMVKVNFVKIDVEGAEAKVLKGAKRNITQGHKISVAITTYHRQNDSIELAAILKRFGYSIAFSKGYMFYLDDEQKPPYLRKGLIRATKY